MKNFLRAPKNQLIIILLIILLASPLAGFPISQMVNFLIVIGSAVGFDLLFLKIRKKELFFPNAAIVSGLIISLIINPSAPIYILVGASLAAMFSKNFIRPTRHIFNPAAFGMMIVALLFLSSTAWSGPSILWGSPLYLLVFLPALVSFYRMKRYLTISTFLISYALMSMIVFKNDIMTILQDPTIIFFSLVMAPEPMTTPASKNNQILFGLFLTACIFIFVKFLVDVPFVQRIDALIFSLLLGNLVFFKRR